MSEWDDISWVDSRYNSDLNVEVQKGEDRGEGFLRIRSAGGV